MTVEARGASRPEAENWLPWSLFFLPVANLLVDPRWIWTSTGRDTWIYFGYFDNGVGLLRTFPDLYYGTRLSVIVPGWLVHHLFSAGIANLVLHLAAYALALWSFHGVARTLFGRRAAWLGALLFGAHPMVLRSLGWNYVDGFGIAYFLFCLLALTRVAEAAPRAAWWAFAAGAAACALIAANIAYAPLLLWAAAHYSWLRGPTRPAVLLRLLAFAAAGFLALFAGFCLLSGAAGGRWLFLLASVQFGSDFIGERRAIFARPIATWLPHAVHLLPAFLSSVAALVGLARHNRGSALRHDRLVHFELLSLAGLMVAAQLAFTPVVTLLQHANYSSLLLPFVGLSLTAHFGGVDALGRREFRRIAGLALVVTVLGPRLVARWVPDLLSWSGPSGRMQLGLMVSLLAAVTLVGWTTSTARRLTVWLIVLGAATSVMALRAHAAPPATGRPLYLQMVEIHDTIDRLDPERKARLWYDMADSGGLFDSVASAMLLCPRMVGAGFPELPEPRLCDGKPLVAGQEIVVMSARPDAEALARQTLERLGFHVAVRSRHSIGGPFPGVQVLALVVG